MSNIYNLDSERFNWEEVLISLKKNGFVTIRNIFSDKFINEVSEQCEEVLKEPSILGSFGYYKKDVPKKLFDPLLLGGNIVDCFVNKKVLSLVKKYLKGEFTLAECNLKFDQGINFQYFPLHKDFTKGWNLRRHKKDNIILSEKDMKSPLGVGAMIYLHDTEEGCFCYCSGSHKYEKDRSSSLSEYPENERLKIQKNMIKVIGKKGDLILFDDSGFHGPDQPSKKNRTVLIFDYYKLETFGDRTKMKIPVFLNDLGHLTKYQLKVLGLGQNFMIPHRNYHTRQFDKTKKYFLLKKMIDFIYFFDFIEIKVKSSLRYYKNKLMFKRFNK